MNKCPLCGTENSAGNTYHPEIKRSEYTRCSKKECGLIYSTIRHNPEKKKELYESKITKYNHYYIAQAESNYLNQKSLFNTFWQIAQRHIAEDFSYKMFEIGSSLGNFLKAAKNSGFREVLGFEINSIQCEYSRNIGIYAIHCDFESYPINWENYWDMCVMCHVIEHFDDPIATLTKIKNMLKTGGLIVTLHPDADVSGVAFHVRDEVETGEHLNIFGRYQLEQLLELVGGLKLVNRFEENPGQSLNVIKKL